MKSKPTTYILFARDGTIIAVFEALNDRDAEAHVESEYGQDDGFMRLCATRHVCDWPD
jgi:hypothetical protein